MILMYLGVAGACAEQKANAAGYTLDGITFQGSANFHGANTVELAIGTGKMVIVDLVGDTIEAFDFDDETMPAVDGSPDESDNPGFSAPRGFTFADDGDYYFVAGTSSPWVKRHALSTAYDVSSAGTTQNISTSLHNAGVQGIAFNDDGTKLFIADQGFVKTVTLTTAYDLSAGSTSSHTISSTTDDDGDAIDNLSCIRFNPDGTKMFLSYRTQSGSDDTVTASHAKIAEFDLSTAYTVSTKSFVRHLDVHPNLGYYQFVPAPPPPNMTPTFIGGFDWNSDGTELFISAVHADAQPGGGSPKILRYSL